jgi:hypothetical protein
VRSLNTLFERLGRLVENERALHRGCGARELRHSARAALKTQAQVARGAADDAGPRGTALDKVIAGCDRADESWW